MTTAARREQMRRYAYQRYWHNRVPAKFTRRETNRQILNKEKLRRGECEMHPSYNNGERKFVVPGLEYLFDMDHVDRSQKHKTIAKMHSDPVDRLLAEIAKCQMLCVECHRRKTVEARDWVQIVKGLQPTMHTVYQQSSLFDIDPL